MDQHPLAPLLIPSSIAIVGASDNSASVGGALFANLQTNFTGPVYLVNAHRTSLKGKPVFRSVTGLTQAVDLAVIATPPETLPTIIEDCGKRGIRAAIIYSSALTSNVPGGAEILSRVAETAARYRIRILGPNSLGIMRPALGLNATFASSAARPGTVALVAQSGALVSAVLDWAEADVVGFSSVISLGNKLDVDFSDVLDFLTRDTATESIVLYMEGLRNARKFMSALRAAARSKPVIVLKAGRDAEGLRAAATHTASMTGRDEVIEAALRRAGAIRVRTFVQLISAAKCLSSRYRATGNRLAIVTNGGGPGVMAADWAGESGIAMARLSESTIKHLNLSLPPAWSHDNPVDLLEDADVGRYRAAVAACMDDPAADGVLVILAPQSMTRTEKVARAIIELTRDNSKHLFACWMGDRSVSGARALFAAARIPVFRTPEPAVEAFSNVATYYQNQRLLMQVPGPIEHNNPPDTERARCLIENALAHGRSQLTPSESMRLLACFRIPIAHTTIANSQAEAVLIAKKIGFPVAMKVNSPDILHKRTAGGVRLNIANVAQVRSAYRDIVAAAEAHAPQARIDGLMIQPMVLEPRGNELLAGLFTDPLFGPVVVFGAGGSDVELIADRAVALPPLNAFLCNNLIDRSRVGKRLRTAPNGVQIQALLDTLLRVSEMACELPWLREMDINPIIVGANGITAVDARVIVASVTSVRDRYAHMAVYPYPTHLTRQYLLADGVVLTLRAIRPEDATIERAFVAALSGESKYFRFISALRELSERMLVRFTQIDYDREMALVAVITEKERDTQIGVARYTINADGESCEFAVVVADAWHGHGIATRLMNALVEAARFKGLRVMEGFVLHNNEKMLKLMRTMGFEIRASADDPSLRHVVKQLN